MTATTEPVVTAEDMFTWPLSKMIRAAVEDMKRVVEMGHVLDMGEFVRDEGNGKCAVCMGGAALMCRLGVGSYEDWCNTHSESRDIAYALDYVRIGCVRNALGELDRYEAARSPEVLSITLRWRDRYIGCDGERMADEDYLAMADELEAVGL